VRVVTVVQLPAVMARAPPAFGHVLAGHPTWMPPERSSAWHVEEGLNSFRMRSNGRVS
jgi:hypothetical protein